MGSMFGKFNAKREVHSEGEYFSGDEDYLPPSLLSEPERSRRPSGIGGSGSSGPRAAEDLLVAAVTRLRRASIRKLRQWKS